MSEPNWYAILGIRSNASAAEIKTAFRKLAHQYHPDKNQNPVYSEQFKQIKKAYEILGNTSTKLQYDRSVLLHKNHAAVAPALVQVPEIMHYFFDFENEMKQADIRFLNYDRIKWKFNYAFGMPHVLPAIQMANKEDQDDILMRQLYCLSFLPYRDYVACLQILKQCFTNQDQIKKIELATKEKKREAQWNRLQIPLVAFISLLLCLGIYWLVK